MAKALIGHVGGFDARLVGEVRRLQQRVRDLESEVLRLRAENDALTAGIHDPSIDSGLISLDDVTLDRTDREPALA